MNIPKILSIAGSDPTGGAGIQADIKAITMLGGYAATALTSITVQDTCKLYESFDLPADLVTKQIEVVINDLGIDVIKTGMLANEEIITAVSKILHKHNNIPAVIDPVMISTSEGKLITDAGFLALKEKLLPQAYLFTPNLIEAKALLDMNIEDLEDMKNAGKKLLKMGAKNILLKGGHLSTETIYDVLFFTDGKIEIFESAKIITNHTHGTGCSLASSIACLLGKGYALSFAVDTARKYIYQAIKTAPQFGTGHGPINHLVIRKDHT